MATIVQYGEITLYNVVTRRWSQEAVYDETDTDPIGARLSLSFEGIIHAQRVPITNSTSYITAGGGNPASAVSAYRSIRELLNQPRKRLTVIVGTETALDVTSTQSNAPLGGNTDVDNGPKPRHVDVTTVVASSVFRVRFDVECMLPPCPVSAERMVLSNRWSVAETMDSNFYTTRTIEGTLRLAASREFFENTPVGHEFRWLVFPVLETGFRRESVSFTAEADGLSCRYSIVDKQVDHAAPWPATDMQVQHTEGTSDGIKFGSNVQVTLKGPPYVDKRLLIERAIQIADSRLLFLDQSSTPTQIITKADITDFIGPEAMIVLNIQTLHNTESPRALLTDLRVNVLGQPLRIGPAQAEGDEIPGTEYDRAISPLPRLYGYSPEGERRPAVLFMLHVFLKDNLCSSDAFRSVNAAVRFGEEPDDESKENRERQETDVAELPAGSIPETEVEDRYRDEAKAAIYTVSKITSQYVTESMKVAAPIARRLTPSNPTSSTNVVLDLCDPQAWKTIEVDVERIGELPQVPEPLAEIRDGTLVATRMRKDERIYPPVLTADGRYEVFRIEAVYWYSLNRPPLDNELLRIGSHHFAQGLVNLVAPSQFYDSQLA